MLKSGIIVLVTITEVGEIPTANAQEVYQHEKHQH